MNDIITLEETGAQLAKKGKRWLVTLARPGLGTSGYYPESVLKTTGPTAIPAGTKAFFKHADNKDRDVRDMVGKYEDGAFWNEEEGELQAYLTPYPRYEEVLEQAGSDIEASIRVRARKDPKGVVTELVYDRGNTVDLVPFAGLEGSGLKYQVESLFAAAAADSEIGKENKNMDITKEDFAGLTLVIEALSAKFDTFVAESKLKVKGEADAEALSAAVEARVAEALSEYAEVEKSINDADVPVTVKESLKERARQGEDVSSDLSAAVSIVAEARKESEVAPQTRGYGKFVVVEEERSSTDATSVIPTRWSKH